MPIDWKNVRARLEAAPDVDDKQRKLALGMCDTIIKPTAEGRAIAADFQTAFASEVAGGSLSVYSTMGAAPFSVEVD
jgi:hypothetical protein